MLLSIFNSDRRAGRWKRSLLLGLFIALSALAALEILMRAHGSGPSVLDDERLWSAWRRKAARSEPNSLLLLGSSRMQLDFSTEAWRKTFPNHLIAQLAINGGNSLPILEDIANKTDFAGAILCEFDYWHLIPNAQYTHAQEFAQFYHDRWFSPFLDLEVWLRAQTQDHFAFLRNGAGIGKAFKGLLTGKGLKFTPYYVRVYYDRNIDADYQRVDLSGVGAKFAHDTEVFLKELSDFTAAQQESQVKRFREAVLKIQSRGGRVVLVRLPTSGQVLELERSIIPRETHWDPITKDLPSVHFEDISAVKNIQCPDGSHLDFREKPNFTAALAETIRSRNLLN